MKQREVIEFTEEQVEHLNEDSAPEGFEWIEETQTDFDGEKGSAYFDVILKRLLDNKFFKSTKYMGTGGYSKTDTQFEEVFPKTVTTTIYE